MNPNETPREAAARPAPSVIIYQGELDYVSRCILDRPSIETGGQLFGYWTASGVPVVLYAIGPGPHANHEVAFFNQDMDYLVAAGRRLIDRFGLQHVGEWHSHHGLGLASPSGHDAETMAHGIQDRGLGRFLLCIGTCRDGLSDFRAYPFHEGSGTDCRRARWDVKPGESPFRALADSDPVLRELLVHPETMAANRTRPEDEPTESDPFAEGNWLHDRRNHAELKKILDFLSAGEAEGCYSLGQTADAETIVTVRRKDGEEQIVFPNDFPHSAPRIRFPHATGPAAPDFPWNRNGSISDDFTEYYQQCYFTDPQTDTPHADAPATPA